MKKVLYSVVVFLLSCMCIPSVRVMAQDKEEARLSTLSSEVFLNQRSIIEVTYANRVAGEELEAVSNNTSILKVKLGKWSEDVKNVIVIPQKAGTAVITITGPDKEKLKITVHVSERKRLTANELYKDCSKAVVEVVTRDAAMGLNIGSGFFINGNMVVTNYHVIDCASSIEIRDNNENIYEVDCIYDYNPSIDIAVLGVKKTSKSALIVNYSKVETGEEVYAIGSPLWLTGSMSQGMVSKAYREKEGIIYHQNTASISQSSGGGPLLNCFGEVIGINTSRIVAGQNINFSLDIKYLDQLNYSKKEPIEELYAKNAGKIKPNEIYITLP